MAEENFGLSDDNYRLLIEKSIAGILVYTKDKIILANAPLAELLQVPTSELLGKSIWDFVHEKDAARVRELVHKREAEGGEDLHYECRLVRKDGKTIWVDIASSIANFQGKTAVLVSMYDITPAKDAQQKQLELIELARKQEDQLVHSTRLAELGEMAAMIAHELNQPLTGIRNFAKNAVYMIENGAGTGHDVKNNLHLISAQVDRASRIINQMRELTRRAEPHFTSLDINSTVQESVEFLKPQMRLSGVEVATNLANGLPKVHGDRIRLEQVFLNLLTNARQAMEESAERRLTVRTFLDKDRSQPVGIEITDTGKGFAPDEAKKLFTPFFSTKKAGHGTGLGLSISLRIIKDHEGRIDAAGQPGKGACFTVRLPINLSAPDGEK